MLTEEQVQIIDRTRELLRKLEADTLMETRFPYGKFAEACTQAENSLFNVLIIAKHWLPEISEPDREEEVV